jgi:DNA-binding protein HU-beta
MNKSELIEEIAGRTRVPPKEVAVVIEAFIDAVKRRVVRGDKVVLSGFGTFHRRARARRVARNIWADEQVSVPAMNVPAFRPGKPFKEAVARRRRTSRPRSTGRDRGGRSAAPGGLT